MLPTYPTRLTLLEGCQLDVANVLVTNVENLRDLATLEVGCEQHTNLGGDVVGTLDDVVLFFVQHNPNLVGRLKKRNVEHFVELFVVELNRRVGLGHNEPFYIDTVNRRIN